MREAVIVRADRADLVQVRHVDLARTRILGDRVVERQHPLLRRDVHVVGQRDLVDDPLGDGDVGLDDHAAHALAQHLHIGDEGLG